MAEDTQAQPAAPPVSSPQAAAPDPVLPQAPEPPAHVVENVGLSDADKLATGLAEPDVEALLANAQRQFDSAPAPTGLHRMRGVDEFGNPRDEVYLVHPSTGDLYKITDFHELRMGTHPNGQVWCNRVNHNNPGSLGPAIHCTTVGEARALKTLAEPYFATRRRPGM